MKPLYTALEALGKLDPQVIRDNELDVTAGCFSHTGKTWVVVALYTFLGSGY